MTQYVPWQQLRTWSPEYDVLQLQSLQVQLQGRYTSCFPDRDGIPFRRIGLVGMEIQMRKYNDPINILDTFFITRYHLLVKMY